MIHLTRPQRESLKRKYNEGPLARNPGNLFFTTARAGDIPVSYRQFRRGVRPYFGGDCVLIPWQGMWLGIEKDGYTHS